MGAILLVLLNTAGTVQPKDLLVILNAETQKLLQTSNVMTLILQVKMDAVQPARLSMDIIALESLQSVLQLVAMN